MSSGLGLTLDAKLLDDTLGALFIGFGFSTALFGILTTQVFSYYRQFQNDALYIKILVPFVWSLELMDQVFIGHGSYHYTVTQWGNPIGIIAEKPQWSLVLGQTFGTIVGTCVKCVFTIRVWTFSGRNIFVTGLIGAVIALQFGCGMYYTKRALEQPTFVTSIQNLKGVATFALTSGFISDLLTAVALAFYLRKMRTGYQRSDSLINSLIRYGLGTGFVSGAMSLTTLILYNVKPQSFDVLASFFVLSKILAISLLSSLNTRQTSRNQTSSQHRSQRSNVQLSAPLSDSIKMAEAGMNSMGQSDVMALQAGMPQSQSHSEPSDMKVLQPNRAVV